jgi:hypothetical protein
MQQPKKRLDTPLATSPKPGVGGGFMQEIKKARAKKEANKAIKEYKKKEALEQGGKMLKSDLPKNI